MAQFIDPETSKAVILAYRVRGNEEARVVFPKRLDASKTYAIIDPFPTGEPERVTGGTLVTEGLRISLAPESAKVFYLKPQS